MLHLLDRVLLLCLSLFVFYDDECRHFGHKMRCVRSKKPRPSAITQRLKRCSRVRPCGAGTKFGKKSRAKPDEAQRPSVALRRPDVNSWVSHADVDASSQRVAGGISDADLRRIIEYFSPSLTKSDVMSCREWFFSTAVMIDFDERFPPFHTLFCP